MDTLGDVKDNGNQCLRQYFQKKVLGKNLSTNTPIREVFKFRIYQKK